MVLDQYKLKRKSRAGYLGKCPICVKGNVYQTGKETNIVYSKCHSCGAQFDDAF